MVRAKFKAVEVPNVHLIPIGREYLNGLTDGNMLEHGLMMFYVLLSSDIFGIFS